MEATEQLDALYEELPTVACKGKCQESCGPIYMSRVEWERIKVRLGWVPKGKSLTCPMLHRASGQCRVYDIRPMLCRLWGIVDTMPCKWGCQPSRTLNNSEGHGMLSRAADIGG